MKYTIAGLLLVAVATSTAHTQTIAPQLKQLDFTGVAAHYNTYDDHRRPMAFLAGFELICDARLSDNNAIEVLFNPISGVNLRECALLRWDPLLRVWDTFSGNQVRVVRDGNGVYWSATMHEAGVFALMKELKLSGSTLLNAPSGYRAENWRYVQPNAGVVCEGFTRGQVIEVPMPSLSPMASISVQMRKNGEPAIQITDVRLGTLAKGMWKEVAAVNVTFDLMLAGH